MLDSARTTKNLLIILACMAIVLLTYVVYIKPKGILLFAPQQQSNIFYRQTGIEQLPQIQLTIPTKNPMADLFTRELTKEPATNQLMFAFIEQNTEKAMIFDAGGHVGDTSLWLAQFAKTLKKPIKIITADPNEAKIRFIQEVARMNNLDNLIIVQSAVGDQASKGQEITARKKQSSFFYQKIAAPMYQVKPDPNGAISIRTIDDIIATSNINDYPLKILHLDVEGYEFLALKGARQQILKHKPLAIIELSNQTEQWVSTAMHKQGYANSKKIAHEFNNTIYFTPTDKNHKALLNQLALLP